MTHQIFLLMSKDEADLFYSHALSYNVSLNQKHKRLFHDDGIRLGTQQIARFAWEECDIVNLAQLLFFIKNNRPQKDIMDLRKSLINKKMPHFTYNEIIIE